MRDDTCPDALQDRTPNGCRRTAPDPEVFEELQAKRRTALRYVVFELADGSFVHFVTRGRQPEPAPCAGGLPDLPERHQGALHRAAAGRRPHRWQLSDARGVTRRQEATAACRCRLLGELRPKLHRYCARMTGSVIDGEDVVQDALVKALEAFSANGVDRQPEGWLFRIAHNAALDSLRRPRAAGRRVVGRGSGYDLDPATTVESPDRRRQPAHLHALPVAQRSSVILMDVLGYSLEEIGGSSTPAFPPSRLALHRARTRLSELAQEPDDRAAAVLARARSARVSPPMSTASTRTTSTPSATCWRTRCGSSSSTARA